ncbi:hypothetical protein K439DRAFT_1627109 [Ramaria rubella]|nr:hypothetical protein K439DRAFT_1627109 [Ramaria rubella]
MNATLRQHKRRIYISQFTPAYYLVARHRMIMPPPPDSHIQLTLPYVRTRTAQCRHTDLSNLI